MPDRRWRLSVFCVMRNRSLPSRWISTRERWDALGSTWPGGTRHRGVGRPASRRVHTPSGPRKSGIPESVLMPAPVKAIICSHLMIHRAIVSMCCSRRCSLVMGLTVKRLIVAKTAYQAASLERMRCSVYKALRRTAEGTYYHVASTTATTWHRRR